MGLDMWCYAVDPDKWDNTTAEPMQGCDMTKVMYWRKNNKLHDFMEKIYRERGGNCPEFNLIPLRLNKVDLTRLEYAIKENRLRAAAGFLPANSPSDDETVLEDLTFIRNARALLDEGLILFYLSWW